MSSAKPFLTRFSRTQPSSQAQQVVLNVHFPHPNVLKFSTCAETSQRKQTTQPVADESNFSYCCRVGIQDRRTQSCDLPLECDWWPGLLGFTQSKYARREYATHCNWRNNRREREINTRRTILPCIAFMQLCECNFISMQEKKFCICNSDAFTFCASAQHTT